MGGITDRAKKKPRVTTPPPTPVPASVPTLSDESVVGKLPTFQGSIFTREPIDPRFGGRRVIDPDTGLPSFSILGTTERAQFGPVEQAREVIPFDPERGFNVDRETGRPLRAIRKAELQGMARANLGSLFSTPFKTVTDPLRSFAEAGIGEFVGGAAIATVPGGTLKFGRSEQFIEDVVEPLVTGEKSPTEIHNELLERLESRPALERFFVEAVGDPTNLITGGTLALTRSGAKAGFRNLVTKGGTVVEFVGATATRPTNTIKAVLGIGAFDLVKPTTGQAIRSGVEEAVGQAVRGVPFASQDELSQIGSRIMSQRAANEANIASNSTIYTERLNAQYVDAFSPLDINQQGQITGLIGIDSTLPGAPTIQDVAARLPMYWSQLNATQKQALMDLKSIISSYRSMFDEVGIDVGQRLDIQEGGFYIPRGDAVVGDLDEPIKIGRSGRGGKTGAERQARYKSMADGIEDGAEYSLFKDTLGGFFGSMGHRVNDQLVVNTLKDAVDPTTGIKLATVTTGRLPISLRAAHDKLLRSMTGARNTLRHQTNRLKAQINESNRAARQTDVAAGRTANAESNFIAAEAAYDAADIKQVRGLITRLIADARHLSFDFGRQVEQLKAAKQNLSQVDIKMGRDYETINTKLTEVEAALNQSAIDPAVHPEQLFALYKRATALDNQLDELFIKGQPLFERVDDLIAKGDIQKELISDSRDSVVKARKLERNLVQQSRSVSLLDRELKLLTREQRRTERLSLQAQQRGLKTAFRVSDTTTRLDGFKEELAGHAQEWRAAIIKSQEVPRDRGRILRSGLQGLDFPAGLAAEIDRGFNPPGRSLTQKTVRIPLDVANIINQIYRRFGATGDNSAPFIQGLLLLGSNQGAATAALKVNARTILAAFAPGKDSGLVYGRYLRMFNESRAEAGRLTSDAWARLRLHQGIGEFEAAIGKVPFEDTIMGNAVTSRVLRGGRRILRESNIAFNNFTNTARLEWADDMLLEELSKGRTLDEIISSGDAANMASIANKMTGHAPQVAFTNYAELLLFAPRFLQARMETLGNALIGAPSLIGLNPAANLQQRQAARAMTRMISWAVMMTNVINEAQGRETDWRPTIKDPNGNTIRNPNFMRIRAFDRDWSMLGTWGSLAGAIINVGAGNPEQALRSMGSGTLTILWDKLSGADAIGQPVPGFKADPVDQAVHLMGNIVPFSAQESGQIAGDIYEGLSKGSVVDKLGAVGAGTITTAGELLGVNSSPLTVSEKIEEARDDKRIEMNLEGDFRGLTGAQKDEIDETLEIAELLDERIRRNRERNSTWQSFLDGADVIINEVNDSKEAKEITLGPSSGLRAEYQKLGREMANRLDQHRTDSLEDIKFFDNVDRDRSAFELAKEDYIRSTRGAIFEDPNTGRFLHDKLEKAKREVRARHAPGLIDEVEADFNRNDSELETDLRETRELLKEYWNWTTKAAEFLGAVEELQAYDSEVDRIKAGEQRAFSPELDRVFELASEARRRVRKNDPTGEIEFALWRWQYQPFIGSDPNRNFKITNNKAKVLIDAFEQGRRGGGE